MIDFYTHTLCLSRYIVTIWSNYTLFNNDNTVTFNEKIEKNIWKIILSDIPNVNYKKRIMEKMHFKSKKNGLFKNKNKNEWMRGLRWWYIYFTTSHLVNNNNNNSVLIFFICIVNTND